MGTEQQEVERSYHIFYQLLQPYGDGICEGGLRAKCFVSADIYDYIYVSQGKTKVDSIDDDEELLYTEDAFNVLGFGAEEKFDCYVLTAGVMTCGGTAYETKGRDDQAEIADHSIESFPGKAAAAFGVDPKALFKAFCKPRIKVGTEWVTKGQTCEQAHTGVGGIARATFDRIFKWLIIKCNDTLIDKSMKKANFCAVLDIAGFEMFDYNGFEQISINFVNEKLQQFFNNHRFVVEQELYQSEGLDVAMQDFGMDLAACIIMFEKPLGIWSILEEESNFPKATDKTYEDKVKAQHLGKSPCMVKAKSATDPHAHFAIVHYAGTVSYNVTGWLEKNKDPVNDSVVDVLKRGTCELMKTVWADHPGQSAPQDNEKKKKKKGGGKTVASVYLVQLAELMATLNSTEPHFIRCIVPNTHKKPLETETPLIMHQLTCNGVLEGIRVCMLGFPNRMLYRDYKARYQVLGAEILATAGNDKEGVFKLMTEVEFPAEKYRCGHTMVFFRAGALAALEEARDGIVLKLVRWMQGQAFGRIRRVAYQKKADQRELMKVIQRNFRKYMILRSWGWFVIIQKTKPLVGQQNPEQELAELEALATAKYGAYEDALKTKARLQEENVAAKEEIQALIKQIEAEQGNMSQYTDRQASATAEKTRLEGVLVETGNMLVSMQQSREDATVEKKELEAENGVIKKDIEDLELAIQKLEQEKTNRDHNIRSLNDEIANQDEVINKLNKEKKHVAENNSKASEDLQSAEDKVSHLNNVKSKLESTFDELEDSLNKEKRARADIEKKRRKIEGDLKVAQETVMDAERGKKELEAGIARKEKDLSGLSSRLEDEQTIVAKAQKAIKETQARVEEPEEELEAERQARAKAEGQRSNLARELDQLGGRLTEAGGATAAQIELNKKRDSEIGKLRKDLEEAHIQQESTMMNLKRKHQDAVAEMSEQIDQLSKMKAKIEKDKGAINHEIADVRAATEEINRSKASAEKSNKTLISQLNDANKKVEEANLTLGDFENAKRKMAAENADLLRSVQELENNANIVSKYKIQLVSALDEAKKVADAEAKERQALLGKFKNLEHDLDGSKAMMDEESGAKDDILRQVAKACSEADMWRSKYENEAVAKAEDLEMTKLKLQARLSEAESTTEQLDRIVAEWKGKADGLGMDLDVAQKEARNASSE